MSRKERAVSNGSFSFLRAAARLIISLTNGYYADNDDVKQKETNIADDDNKAYGSNALIARKGNKDIDDAWEKTMSLMLPAEMDALGGDFL